MALLTHSLYLMCLFSNLEWRFSWLTTRSTPSWEDSTMMVMERLTWRSFTTPWLQSSELDLPPKEVQTSITTTTRGRLANRWWTRAPKVSLASNHSKNIWSESGWDLACSFVMSRERDCSWHENRSADVLAHTSNLRYQNCHGMTLSAWIDSASP